jgi:hypothetical protein
VAGVERLRKRYVAGWKSCHPFLGHVGGSGLTLSGKSVVLMSGEKDTARGYGGLTL